MAFQELYTPCLWNMGKKNHIVNPLKDIKNHENKNKEYRHDVGTCTNKYSDLDVSIICEIVIVIIILNMGVRNRTRNFHGSLPEDRRRLCLFVVGT